MKERRDQLLDAVNMEEGNRETRRNRVKSKGGGGNGMDEG